MSVLPILRWPDARLSTVCEPAVLDDELRQLATDMLETMYDAPGRGLAAPQVGRLSRLFVMDVAWKEGAPAPVVMVNPEVEATGAEVATAAEGCLSIPGILADVPRPATIRMSWTDLEGNRVTEDLEGAAARCAQHELDHLNGIVTFDRVTPDERAALEAAYDA